MGVYVYTLRKQVKELNSGFTVGLYSYAYKSGSHLDYDQPLWLKRSHANANKNLEFHNKNGFPDYFVKGYDNKFEDGQWVFTLKSIERAWDRSWMEEDSLAEDYVGILRKGKRGQGWFIEMGNPSQIEAERRSLNDQLKSDGVW